MCGIAGYHGLAADRPPGRMNACQVHRGPDGDGILIDGPCGLAHRRLSIIDVAHGQQPMETADGRFTSSPTTARSTTTSTCAPSSRASAHVRDRQRHRGRPPGVREWGADAFDRFNGMFGLAVWDRDEQTLTLARDHFGIKPLYLAPVPGQPGGRRRRAGSSRARSGRSSPAASYERRPNERAVYRYLRFRVHDDGAETFFDGHRAARCPARWLTIDADGVERRCSPRLQRGPARAARPARGRTTGRGRRRLPRRASPSPSRLRLRSDVPVGTSLSGGLDSSARRGPHRPAAAPRRRAVDRSVGPRQNTFSAVFPGFATTRSARSTTRSRSAPATSTRTRSGRRADEFKADLPDFVRTQEEPRRLVRPVRAVPRHARGEPSTSPSCSTARAPTRCWPATSPTTSSTCASCAAQGPAAPPRELRA